MHRAFRRLPLAVKLLLIGFIPLVFLVYMSFHTYNEKTQKLKLLRSFVERVRQSADINILVDHLEMERKLSFDYAMKASPYDELAIQRLRTDSIITILEKGSLAGFRKYTFLDKLNRVRELVDSTKIPIQQVTHYYITSLYRINTLNAVSAGSEIYLQPVYKDLVAQKLLSEMITNLGIIRSNIYTALYLKKYLVETLVGMIGVHDVYKAYETEFLMKASPEAVEPYKKLLGSSSLKPTIEYIDTLFTRFKPDSSYTAERWWQTSGDGIQQLINLRQKMRNNVNKGTNNLLHKETTARNRMLVLMVLMLVLVIGIAVYTIYSITYTLRKMKVAAQKISEGETGVQLPFDSRDAIGSLAKSILKIDATNKRLADAAYSIGNGNFDVVVEPRGNADVLGNAIKVMKNNLLQNINTIKETNEQSLKTLEKYKTIFYKSPLPKWIYDFETLQFLDVNEEAIRHYGYSREEFLSMTLMDMRKKEDRGRLEQHMKELKGDPSDNHGNWQHVKKNGELIIVEVTAHFIDYNGRKARMAVIQDITEKLKVEQQLAASEKRFRSIIEELPYPVVIYDADGNYTSVNKAWETMWQYKREDVPEYNIRKDPQMISSGLSVYIEKAFAGEVAVSDPYLYDPALIGHPNSPKKWMVMTLYPLKNIENEVLEVILILQDITETKKAEEQLQQSHEQLRDLASRLQDIREDERASIAREVHDELGQQITCLKMDISWLHKKLHTDNTEIDKKIKEMLALIDNTAITIRKIATELRPSILDDFGLVEALHWHSREFEKKSGMKIKFNSSTPDINTSKNIGVALFRIYQESLTNVARHAEATEVTATLDFKNGQLYLAITDNGKGFDINKSSHKKTLGLLGMKERTLMIGGKYEITSTPGEGTSVLVSVPLQT